MSLWVFGYGSLLWNPGFPVAEQAHGRLAGYARSFCMYSIHHRGTEEDPGLVLALDAHDEAVCDGLALRAEPGTEDETLAYLRERELTASAYVEHVVPLHLADGQVVQAYTYVVDPADALYCGHLTLEDQAQIIAHAAGDRGPNADYLLNTVAHLEEIGIGDGDLSWLATRVRDLRA